MLQKHGLCWWDYVHLSDGRRVRRALARDLALAKTMGAMLKWLRARREWEFLNAVADKRITVGALWDYYNREDGLRELREKLRDTDLALLVEGWNRWVAERASAAAAAKYLKQLRVVLIPEGTTYYRSEFTRRRLSEALSRLACASPTKRRYHAALSSFGKFLVEREVLDVNPMRSVKAPRNSPPRNLWLPLADVLRLVDAQPEPFRALAALREGAGVEISAALSVRRMDVDLEARTVHVHGTKTLRRDRIVVVEDWAVVRLGSYLRKCAMTGAALLFEGVTDRRALDVQREALKALKLDESYRLHDARHSFAVRMMKAGLPPQLIASNLGHVDANMVLRVYGKYSPTPQDWARQQLRKAQR